MKNKRVISCITNPEDPNFLLFPRSDFEMTSRKALITGGTGFIGRALAAKLLEKGYAVRILTRGDPSKVSMPGAEGVQASFKDITSLKKAVEGCDVIFHLAAALFAYSYEEFEAANTSATGNLASACSNSNTKRFVYVSSLAAGGPSKDPSRPRAEASEDAPVSFYGATKLGGEKELAKKLDPTIEKVILRPPIVYGKNESGFSKISQWVNRGIMINAGSGTTYFSFIFLDDLIDALIIAAENENVAGKTYFVCEDSIYTWDFFINTMAHVMSKKKPVIINLSQTALNIIGMIYEKVCKVFGFPPIFNRDKAKEAYAGHWIASPEKWMTDTGWKKWTPLEEGLKKSF